MWTSFDVSLTALRTLPLLGFAAAGASLLGLDTSLPGLGYKTNALLRAVKWLAVAEACFYLYARQVVARRSSQYKLLDRSKQALGYERGLQVLEKVLRSVQSTR
jgi:hypothetical protein